MPPFCFLVEFDDKDDGADDNTKEGGYGHADTVKRECDRLHEDSVLGKDQS